MIPTGFVVIDEELPFHNDGKQSAQLPIIARRMALFLQGMIASLLHDITAILTPKKNNSTIKEKSLSASGRRRAMHRLVCRVEDDIRQWQMHNTHQKPFAMEALS